MAEAATGKASSLVPEVYYDLIARVTPGAVFLLAIGHSVRATSLINGLGAGTAALVSLGGLAASYFLGMIADSVSFGLRYWLVQRWEPAPTKADQELLNDFAADLGLPRSCCRKEMEELGVVARKLIHEVLKASTVQVRELLVKWSAETSLCFNTMVLSIAFAIFHAIHGWSTNQQLAAITLGSFEFWGALGLAFAAAIGARYRQRRLAERHLLLLRLARLGPGSAQYRLKQLNSALKAAATIRGEAAEGEKAGKRDEFVTEILRKAFGSGKEITPGEG